MDLPKLSTWPESLKSQDLEKLEKNGLVIREHGGVHLKNVEDQVRNFSLVHQDNLKEKEIIAEKCLEFIHPGDTIILDSGSTTTEIAKKIINIKGLTVITMCRNSFWLLQAYP